MYLAINLMIPRTDRTVKQSEFHLATISFIQTPALCSFCRFTIVNDDCDKRVSFIIRNFSSVAQFLFGGAIFLRWPIVFCRVCTQLDFDFDVFEVNYHKRETKHLWSQVFYSTICVRKLFNWCIIICVMNSLLILYLQILPC